MIVGDECETLRFSKLRAGDVFQCPQSREFFMTVTLHEGMNCVQLSDGRLYNRLDVSKVDFYRGARLVVP